MRVERERERREREKNRGTERDERTKGVEKSSVHRGATLTVTGFNWV